jgi:dTDP-4-dehydrorhamnose reductase
VLSTLRANQPLSAFGDVYFTPSLADRVARWGHALSAAGEAGVFHVCGDERVSKYEFAYRLATMAALPVDLIRETRVEEAGLKAPRPRDMSLSTEKARRVLGVPATRLDDDLRRLLDLERSGRRAELLRAVST